MKIQDSQALDNRLRQRYREYFGEFNDGITRLQILNEFRMILKSIEEVKDFYVVCDDSNNPPTAVDNNDLVVDVAWFDYSGNRYHTRYDNKDFE